MLKGDIPPAALIGGACMGSLPTVLNKGEPAI